MSDNGQQVPLIERLRRVPAAARVLEHTPNPLGYDTDGTATFPPPASPSWRPSLSVSA